MVGNPAWQAQRHPSSRIDPVGADRTSEEANLYDMSREANAPEDYNLLWFTAQAIRISKEYHTQSLERGLQQSYRAYRSEHQEGSKYLSRAWRGRARLFVPKTRSAVRKNNATTAAALFTTENVVTLSPAHADDPVQSATAATLHADMNTRLENTDPKTGVPWFHMSMGACHDAQITGVCCSKQTWNLEERPTGNMVVEEVEEYDEELDEFFYVTREVPEMMVVRDAPSIELHPIENLGIDPAAPWYSPVELGAWFYCRYPMRVEDVREMMARGNRMGDDQGWLEDVPDQLLMKGKVEEERRGLRRVREGGVDRLEDTRTTPGPWDIVWINENFVRVDGRHHHYWSVGSYGYLSEVREVHEVYPAFGGARPYILGLGALESHLVLPTSPVESWQPLQLEINDITNLRLDTLKRGIAPLPKIKRGKNVDYTQLQMRGRPDAYLEVEDMDDIDFAQTPTPPGQSYAETNVQNANFDELAGAFSPSSVQTSRSLNETVGGMQLLSGAANAVTEYDLRVFVMTWVQPTLYQVAQLLRYYESDEALFLTAGKKASVLKKFEYEPVLDDLDTLAMTLKVDVGIGSADPMQKLAKLKFGMEMLAPIMGEAAKQGITLNAEAVISEVMGQAGFSDGRRFFNYGEPQPEQPPPEVIQLLEELKFKYAELQTETDKDLAIAELNNATDYAIAQLRGEIDHQKTLISAGASMATAGISANAARANGASNGANGSGGGGGSRGPAPPPPENVLQDLRNVVEGPQSPPVPMGTPDQAGNGALAVQAMMGQLDQLGGQVQQVAAMVQAVMDHMAAPVEVLRDENENPIGIRKGGQQQRIIRDSRNRIGGAVTVNAPGGAS